MDYEEAKKKAEESGGQLAWSSDKGYYVITAQEAEKPEYGEELVPTTRTRIQPEAQRTFLNQLYQWLWGQRPPVIPPWETPKGEGFIAPWTRASRRYTGGLTPEWYQPRKEVARAPQELLDLPMAGTEQDKANYALYRALGGDLPFEDWLAQGKPSGFLEPMKPLTYEEALQIARRLGAGYRVTYNPETGGYEPTIDPFYVPPEMRMVSPSVSAQLGLERWQTQQELGLSREELELRRELAEQQLAWEKERFAQQQEMERQRRLAQLAAQPMSWLQYAAEAQEPAVVQPWMLPLMPQQYKELQVGQPIPGFKGIEGMKEMPELTRPSAQYQARISPTALQQYYGYRQARTGARPEDIEFRLWSTAPPSGRYAGLSRRS
jgi:hypothetical protein